MAYLLNAQSPSDVANWARQQNVPTVPNLGFLSGRPNRAIEYGHYNVLPVQPVPHLSSLGTELTVNMEFLLGGVSLLALGLYLLGRRKSRRRRIRTMRRRILS